MFESSFQLHKAHNDTVLSKMCQYSDNMVDNGMNSGFVHKLNEFTFTTATRISVTQDKLVNMFRLMYLTWFNLMYTRYRFFI